MSKLPTLVWCGRFSNEDGYGTAARSLVKAVRAAGIPYIAIDTGTLTTFGASDESAFVSELHDDVLTLRAVDNATRCLVVVHDRPDRYPTVGTTGRVRRVGYSYCEALSIPEGWITTMLAMDEVWTSSENNRSTFSSLGIPDRMLRTTPIPIDVDRELGDAQRRARWAETTVFLTVASALARRDLRVLYESYARAFTAADNVTLVLKVRPGGAPDTEAALTSVMLADPGRSSGTWPRVEIIEADLTREQMHRLQSEADVYVSTERGNGWCIPAFDSMAMGRPVISFDWGGSADFLDPADCYVVPVHQHLVYGSDSVHVSNWMYDTNLWPTVDPVPLAAAFRQAADDPGDRRDRGRRAEARLRATMDPDTVGQHLIDLISEYGSFDFGSNGAATIEVAADGSRWTASTEPSAEELLQLRLIGLASDRSYRRPLSPRGWFTQYKRITTLATTHRQRLPKGSNLKDPLASLVSTPTSRPFSKALAVAAFNKAVTSTARTVGGAGFAREAEQTLQDHDRCVAGQRSAFSLDDALERRRRAWAAVGGVRPNAADRRRLAALRGRHHGDRIIVMGNGLEGLDPARFADQATFGIDHVPSRVAGGWLPTFYTVVDGTHLGSLFDDLDEDHTMTTFYPEQFRGLLRSSPDTYWFHTRGVGDAIGDRFETDATNGLPVAGALSAAVQLAFHLGYRDLVLIGVDEEPGRDRGRLEHELADLRKGAEFHGARLRNATPGSDLEALETVDLDDVT